MLTLVASVSYLSLQLKRLASFNKKLNLTQTVNDRQLNMY